MRKKAAAIFITLCVLASALASCVDRKDGGAAESGGVSSIPAGTDTGVLTDAGGYIIDNLPDTLGFGGKTATVLYWNDVEHTEFEVENISGELVEDAIYLRNRTAESRLDVTLSYCGIPGNVSNIAPFVKAVQTMIQAGDHTYDIVGSYSSTAGTLAYNGLAYDLLELDNLDFDMPWWPGELIGTSTLGGHLYFCSGDISTNLLHMMYACFFNKSYLTDYSLEDPYALVDSGKWTYEAFGRMASDIYGDLDGNTVKSDGDRYGYATYWLHLDGLFGSVGIKSVEKNNNDLLMISPSYGSEKTQDFLEYINSMFSSSSDWCYLGTSGAKTQQKIFAEGRSLFMTERVRVCQNVLRFTEINYGILPIPKYDENQEDYITAMAMPFTMYTVPANVSDGAMTGAVLECLASEGYRKVTPALFEVAMKTRYSSDDISSRMYDVVRGHVTFDLGRIFNESLGKIPNATLRGMVDTGASTWISKYKSLEKSLDNYIKLINEALEG